MPKINSIEKMTDNRYLNMYRYKVESEKGHKGDYFVASRAETTEDLKINKSRKDTDAVIIYALYGEKHDRVVLERQFRYPIGGYIYEFPAGLIDKGENYKQTAVREMHEETGLDLEILDCDPMFENSRYTSVGMSDESVSIVYGYAKGKTSEEFMESGEDIKVVLADREEVKRILKEEEVSMNCAYHLMHFLVDEDPFSFIKR